MHVLLIHQAFAAIDEPGGTRHHEMARLIAQAGHQVTVLAGGVSYMTGGPGEERQSPADQVDDMGVRIQRVSAYDSWHRSFVHRVLSFVSFMVSSFWAGLKLRQVDVVWGTSPPLFQALSAWALARVHRAGFVFEVRDLWPHFAIAVGVLRNSILIGAARAAEWFLYRRADQLVVNSPGFVEHVQSRGGERITVIPNGVDSSMFDPKSRGEDFRRRHGLEDAFLVVYAGAHGMSNDLGVVLQAAAGLERPDIQFALLGDGKEKPALQRRAEQLGLDNVHFLPPRPKAQMAEALAAADACLAILKPIEAYKTTYPNKVFDYMAAGRPVLLAIDGVVRDVVERADAGVFVPPGDPAALRRAVVQLATEQEKARDMGRRGRQYVQAHFERADQAQALLRVLRRAAGEDEA